MSEHITPPSSPKLQVRYYHDIGQGFASLAMSMSIDNIEVLYVIKSDEKNVRTKLANLSESFSMGQRCIQKMVDDLNRKDGDI